MPSCVGGLVDGEMVDGGDKRVGSPDRGEPGGA